MITRIPLFLSHVFIQFLVTAALTNSDHYVAIKSLKDGWEKVPPSWNGADPCGDHWDGIGCIGSNVVSLTLASLNLRGQIYGDIEGLSELQILDLSYNAGLTGPLPQTIGNLKKLSNLILVGCGFSGQIPDTIGSLSNLKYLSLNSNKFIGSIPPSLGKLSELYWLDLADNKLTGCIPVSNGSTPGLDMLVETKHFHFGKNQLSGPIPAQLFSSKMKLIHLLLERNQLTGSIPETLGHVQSLEVVRLDRNLLSGSVPSNLNNLTSINNLYLSNNNLNGPFPNLNGMNFLDYVDMSNNTFDPTDFPSWLSTLTSLTTLVLENTRLQGPIPASLFSLDQLQNVILRNNKLNGTLSISSHYSSQLGLVDLQTNFIDSFTEKQGYKFQISLTDNPICHEEEGEDLKSYCGLPKRGLEQVPSPTAASCSPTTQCGLEQVPSPTTCACVYPYTGNLIFRAPFFSSLERRIFLSLEESMMHSFQSHQLPVDSVSLSNPTKDLDDYLVLRLQIFPLGQNHFNRTGVSKIGFVLTNQTFKPPKSFGPYFYAADIYRFFDGLEPTRSGKSSNTVIIIGAAVGGSVLLILSLLVGVYAFRQKRRAQEADKKNDPFASWDASKSSGGFPQLNGAKVFSYDEVAKCTENFSETNNIGSGGYGKVYRGTLHNGQLVAIKRSQKGSMQGSLEFKSEIELLSRVHHKNVVGLVGFCFDQGEYILVYEFIPNGTLKESLSGDFYDKFIELYAEKANSVSAYLLSMPSSVVTHKVIMIEVFTNLCIHRKSGIRLDWMRRLRIALGAARGLQYLHDLVNPPIIHRDIKTNNILLDERLNAKVADFGLSKSMGEHEGGHVTTQVKGTMGYLDPEYYMTNQLTEKSDVYSFGVVMLEIVTARPPIEKGKYIVREVKQSMVEAKETHDLLLGVLDPAIFSSVTPASLEKFVELSFRCLEDTASIRPTMREVVKEIENIMVMVGLNPHAESASTSGSYSGASKGSSHPYSD